MPGPFVQISAGEYHNCALTPDGELQCWGFNEVGQAANRPGPYMQVASGWYHTCALTLNGQAECWGNDSHGQATGQTGPYGPYRPTGLSKALAAGATSNCCLLYTSRCV